MIIANLAKVRPPNFVMVRLMFRGESTMLLYSKCVFIYVSLWGQGMEMVRPRELATYENKRCVLWAVLILSRFGSAPVLTSSLEWIRKQLTGAFSPKKKCYLTEDVGDDVIIKDTNTFHWFFRICILLFLFLFSFVSILFWLIFIMFFFV